MLDLFLIITIFTIFAGDTVLYGIVVKRHGSQWKWWPLSGYYVWMKHREKRQRHVHEVPRTKTL